MIQFSQSTLTHYFHGKLEIFFTRTCCICLESRFSREASMQRFIWTVRSEFLVVSNVKKISALSDSVWDGIQGEPDCVNKHVLLSWRKLSWAVQDCAEKISTTAVVVWTSCQVLQGSELELFSTCQQQNAHTPNLSLTFAQWSHRWTKLRPRNDF